MTISNLVRVIPGGLLIFYPSYPVLQKCQEVWQQSGLWSSINTQKVNKPFSIIILQIKNIRVAQQCFSWILF